MITMIDSEMIFQRSKTWGFLEKNFEASCSSYNKTNRVVMSFE